MWNPTGSLLSKVDEEFLVNNIEKEKRISKRDVAALIKSRVVKSKIKIDQEALDCFSNAIGSKLFDI